MARPGRASGTVTALVAGTAIGDSDAGGGGDAARAGGGDVPAGGPVSGGVGQGVAGGARGVPLLADVGLRDPGGVRRRVGQRRHRRVGPARAAARARLPYLLTRIRFAGERASPGPRHCRQA